AAIAKNYRDLKKYNLAIDYYDKSLELSLSLGLLAVSRDNYIDLSNIYKQQGNYVKALEYYNNYSTFTDSILNKDIFDRISELQTQYETEKKEAQIKLQKTEIAKKEAENKRQRLVIAFFIMGLVLIMGLVVVILKSLQQKKKDNKIIAAEKAKSEELLLNTLPIKVVNDLKENGKSEPESFSDVTVYFSDVVGFTNMSSEMEPKALINELNEIFTAFDDIMTKYSCERIKTIGDAYMSVCGMPEPNENHAHNMVNAALEVCEYLRKRNETSKVSWRIRIGLNSGKVVGGIVGVRKYIYDVFGDTINTASRMESNSEPMKINISVSTYHLVKDQYMITKREDREVKGKGKMQMFFVEGPKTKAVS
nr:adenylate/guanylate cyclase domain-containing protein [Bacteroidota bacterium]